MLAQRIIFNQNIKSMPRFFLLCTDFVNLNVEKKFFNSLGQYCCSFGKANLCALYAPTAPGTDYKCRSLIRNELKSESVYVLFYFNEHPISLLISPR